MKSIYKIETMTPDDIKNIHITKQTVSTIEEMFTIIKRRPDLHNTIYEKQFYDQSMYNAYMLGEICSKLKIDFDAKFLSLINNCLQTNEEKIYLSSVLFRVDKELKHTVQLFDEICELICNLSDDYILINLVSQFFVDELSNELFDKFADYLKTHYPNKQIQAYNLPSKRFDELACRNNLKIYMEVWKYLSYDGQLKSDIYFERTDKIIAIPKTISQAIINKPELVNYLKSKDSQLFIEKVLSKTDSQELHEYMNLISSKPIKKIGVKL